MDYGTLLSKEHILFMCLTRIGQGALHCESNLLAQTTILDCDFHQAYSKYIKYFNSLLMKVRTTPLLDQCSEEELKLKVRKLGKVQFSSVQSLSCVRLFVTP